MYNNEKETICSYCVFFYSLTSLTLLRLEFWGLCRARGHPYIISEWPMIQVWHLVIYKSWANPYYCNPYPYRFFGNKGLHLWHAKIILLVDFMLIIWNKKYENLCLIRFYTCSTKLPKGSDLQILHKNKLSNYRNPLTG